MAHAIVNTTRAAGARTVTAIRQRRACCSAARFRKRTRAGTRTAIGRKVRRHAQIRAEVGGRIKLPAQPGQGMLPAEQRRSIARAKPCSRTRKTSSRPRNRLSTSMTGRCGHVPAEPFLKILSGEHRPARRFFCRCCNSLRQGCGRLELLPVVRIVRQRRRPLHPPARPRRPHHRRPRFRRLGGANLCGRNGLREAEEIAQVRQNRSKYSLCSQAVTSCVSVFSSVRYRATSASLMRR